VKIVLLQIGKTTESYLREGVQLYVKRLDNYVPFEVKTLPELKNASSLSTDQQRTAESKLILEALPPSSFLVLLDEVGNEYTSVEFAGFVQQQMLRSIKCMVFVIGGPYGFSEAVYKKANAKVALSKMTFSHQMVRLVFMEQLYRAMTILKNEPYHH
jgi:23S rRNA (pseudouridine1915-N3)-methyltransferase